MHNCSHFSPMMERSTLVNKHKCRGQATKNHRMSIKLKYSNPEHFLCPSQWRSSHSMCTHVHICTCGYLCFWKPCIMHTNKTRKDYSFQFLAIIYKWLRERVAKRMWKQNKKEDFWQNLNRTEKKKNVPVSSKKTNSMAEGRIWIILTKYQITKFWNHFILGKHLEQTSDPCFTTPVNCIFCIPSSTFCPESL